MLQWYSTFLYFLLYSREFGNMKFLTVEAINEKKKQLRRFLKSGGSDVVEPDFGG